MDKPSNKHWTLCIYAALVLSTLAAYWQVRSHEFVNYDDDDYVVANRHVQAGLSRDSITWAFTTGHSANWHPLTWLSHMLDYQLFGLDSGWHHLTNLLLHIINTLLLFAVLNQMTRALWPSAFVAAIFALHPLHVESVAWISERKDVLSTLFWLLTMAAYLRYVKQPGISWYLITLLAFALGLMAKPMLVTLPFVLLLLDYWPLGRFQNGQAIKDASRRNRKYAKSKSQWPVTYRLLWEKVPFFALSAASSIVTFLVQQSAGVIKRIEALPLTIRIANTFISYLKYIGKMVWPSRLAMFYPHPGDNLSMWQAAIAALVLLAISIWVIRSARSHRYLPVGWLWYLGTLVPVIGLVQVGGQALADRYTYIPLTGLFIVIAWGLPDLLKKWRYRKIVLGTSALAVLLALSIGARLQASHWRNSIALFEHAIDVTEDNYDAHFCIAEPLRKQGRIDEAIAHNAESLRIKPNYLKAVNGMGVVLIAAGKVDDAIPYLNKALQLSPNCAEAHVNLGFAFFKQGKVDEAIKEYTEALRIKPDSVIAYRNLGTVLTQQNKLDEATTQYRQIVRLLPNNPKAHHNLAIALVRQDKLDEAITHFAKAVRIKPDFAEAHINLGVVLARQRKFDEAVAHLTKALRIKPDLANVHEDLGNALLQQGKLNEAIKHYTEALRINPGSAKVHSNLGYALMHQGKLDDAIKHYTEALLINPDFAGAHNNLGNAFFRQGKLDEAVKHFTEALRINPDSAEVHNDLGVVLVGQRKLNEAIIHFKKALQIKPDLADARRNLRRTYTLIRKRQLDEAAKRLTEQLRLDPNSAPAHYNLARILDEQGKTKESIAHLKETLRIKPDGVVPMNNLAWLLATHHEAKLRNPEEAVPLAERACELTKYEQPNLLDTLAAAYAAAGRFSEAVTTAEKALERAQSSKQLTEEIQNRLSLYKAGQAFVRTSPKAPSE